MKMTQLQQETQKLKDIARLGGLSLPEFVRRVLQAIYADNCMGQAAQLAYYFLFALFPFLLLLTTLLGYIPVPHLMAYLMSSLARVMPTDVLSLIQDHVESLLSEQRGGLLSFSLLTSLWPSTSAIMAIMDNLNRAYKVHESRPFWKTWGIALLLVIGLSVLIVVGTVLLVFGPQLGSLIAGQVGLGHAFKVGWDIIRWPLSLFFLIFAMANIYYFAPDVEQEWKWITPGSVFSIIIWVLSSLGFSYYVSNFGSYNKIYGSIGTIIILMMWMYLLGFVILAGGEINSEIEHAATSGKDPGQRELPE
jgi:membrane protein